MQCGGKKAKCRMGTQILCIPHKAAIPHPIMMPPSSHQHVEDRQTDHQGWLARACQSCCGSVWPFHVWCPYCNQTAKLQPQPARDLQRYGIADLWGALATSVSLLLHCPWCHRDTCAESEPQHSQPCSALQHQTWHTCTIHLVSTGLPHPQQHKLTNFCKMFYLSIKTSVSKAIFKLLLCYWYMAQY